MATDFELLRDFNSTDFQLVILGDEFLNHVDRDRALLLAQHVAQDFLRQGHRQFAAGQRRERQQSNQRSFEFADVRLDPARNEQRHVVGQEHAFGVGFSLQNRDLGLEIRRLNIGD